MSSIPELPSGLYGEPTRLQHDSRERMVLKNHHTGRQIASDQKVNRCNQTAHIRKSTGQCRLSDQNYLGIAVLFSQTLAAPVLVVDHSIHPTLRLKLLNSVGQPVQRRPGGYRPCAGCP